MGDLETLIPETQKTLGAIIQKPKLTEALLKKPPFRFLHDIVSEVKRVTGFPSSDVLTDYDMDSGNFKDKESKVAYLTKVIGAVTAATGPLQVKPLKIVAGLEPENTNALLQGLAKAATGGGAPAPEKKKPPAEAAPKRAPPPPEEAPKQERPKPAEAPSEDAPAAEAPARRPKERAPPKEEEAAPPPRREIAPAEPAAPPGGDDDGVGRRMERPRTALRGPPKVLNNTAVRDTRPTSKQDASRGAKVIGEGDAGSDDEDDASGALGGGDIVHHGGRGDRAEISAEGRGALVRNMMNAKADMDADAGGGDAPGVGENLADFNRNKDRQKTQEDLEKLREAIQSLCQSSNPLARSMDYLQEDLDNMTKELGMWAKDKDVQTQLLEEEKRLSEIEIDKLMAQLQEVEDKIKEEELHIRDMKAQVLKNDHNIKSMLGSIVRPNR